MPLSACSSGLVVTALVTLLLLPAQYYVPEFGAAPPEPPPAPPAPPRPAPPAPAPARAWPVLDLLHLPALDLLLTFMLLVFGIFIYLCEWIQRKLMEKRIVKLNVELCASVERLRAWDAQQEQLEATLRMARHAAAEYRLLLLLLLRRRRAAAPPAPSTLASPSKCAFDRDIEDEIIFLRNSMLDT